MSNSAFEFPLTIASSITYRLRIEHTVNENLQLYVMHATQSKQIGFLAEEHPKTELQPNQCMIRNSLSAELQEVVETLIEAGILVANSDNELLLFTIFPPIVVRVFHNCNDRFDVQRDPDRCANLTFVATVTIPNGEDPLDWAFRVTNHIDSDWTTNPGVIATAEPHRSTSVGDVMEISHYQMPSTRHIVASFGFESV